MTTVLVRRELPGVNPDDQVTHSVLSYAESKLGYKHPEQQRKLVKSKMAEALRVVGIKPFTAESVLEYKKAEQARLLPNTFWKKANAFAVAVAGICLGFTAVGLCAQGCLDYVHSVPFFNMSRLYDWTTLGLIIGTVFLVVGYRADRLSRKFANWRCRDLQGYGSPVPEFALATAVEIHRRLPEATFQIEELVVGYTEREPELRDPFLIACLGDERYYVEVWAEPNYKQERMA